MEQQMTEQETREEETREEETRDNKIIAQGPSESHFNIFIPDFLPEYSILSLSLHDQNTQLPQKDWLTTGLIEEIEASFPSLLEIKANADNKHDPIAFQHKIIPTTCNQWVTQSLKHNQVTPYFKCNKITPLLNHNQPLILDPFRKHQRNHQPGMVFPPCHNQKESDTE
jgi:hypothetical protein